MIARKVIEIHLREGVKAKLLLTPALYGVARERGIDLFPPERVMEDKKDRVFDLYAKIAYCAAISAWEVDAVDDPDKGDFPWTFEDFSLWSWNDQKEFGQTINAILEALTGKSARDYLREQAQKEAEKKKMRKRSPFRWIMRKSRLSS